MDGATDVPSGRISAGPPGGDGGGGEHPGGCTDFRAAPGHGAQDAGLLSSAGPPAADSAQAVEPFDKLLDNHRVLRVGQ